MVSINLEPLEHLPYLEESITPEERAEVEQLIQIELTNQMNQRMHPRVNELLPMNIHDQHNQALPLGNNSDLLNNRFEEDDDMDDEDVPSFIGGVDMSRYEDTQDINNIYTTLSYSILQQRNDELLAQNLPQVNQSYNLHLQQLNQLNQCYESTSSNKRKAIDDINIVRKKKQFEFATVNDYLQDRWKDGLKSVVDLGVEAKRIEMGL